VQVDGAVDLNLDVLVQRPTVPYGAVMARQFVQDRHRVGAGDTQDPAGVP
jgi:hypothetical protein